MMTTEIVHRRIANFWGYGSFSAPAWFVGMEEGLRPETELEERFRVSEGKATIDIRRDMARIPNANSRGMSYDRLYEFAERVRPRVSLENELAR